MSEPMYIRDPEAARVFANSKPRAILMALMCEPTSLMGLQAKLGFSPSLIHYHLAKLRRLGLVQVLKYERRAGPKIAIYSSTASAFVAPEHLVDAVRTIARQEELNDALERADARNPPDAVVFDLTEGRNPRMRRLKDSEGSTGAGEWWLRLNLTENEARELTGELRGIIGRFASKAGFGGKSYLLHLALAPT